MLYIATERVCSWCIQWMLYIVTERDCSWCIQWIIYINISEGHFQVYTVDFIYSNRGSLPGVYSGFYIYLVTLVRIISKSKN